MVPIPDQHRDLLAAPVYVGLATVLPSGQPHVVPVWCDLDDGYIRINMAAGTRKHRDIVERPRVTVLAVDPANPYRYLEVRGRVARMTEDGADAHIDKLAKDYLGADTYPFRNPAETRIICSIEPEKVSGVG